MKRIFTKEFWNTPIINLPASDKMLIVLVLFGMFMFCVVIAGIAAWRIIY